jgi:malonate-semialdehyde dehydrogenase (acetylating)/methylmalonate-semialdehyde dehydrogenase
MASKQTVEQAISAAQSAYPAWRDTAPQKRASIVFKYKELIGLHADQIVALITDENGKVLDDPMG